MKAYFVKEVQRPGIAWDRHLYQVEPHFQYRDWTDRTTTKLLFTDYLLVSVTTGEREKETLVLPADENGTPLDTTPLSGSLKNDRNHEAALRKMGYTICITDEGLAALPGIQRPTQIEDYDGDFADLAQWEETTLCLATDDDTTIMSHGVTHPKFGVMIWDKTRAADKETFLEAMRARKAEAPAKAAEGEVLCTPVEAELMRITEAQSFPPEHAPRAISTDGEDPITPNEEDEAEDLTIYHVSKSTKKAEKPK